MSSNVALPKHLERYAVTQDENQYTAVDHAVWRQILRELRGFLKDHAHASYLEGLTKTGISFDHIPTIASISRKLEEFGWRAIPVSGFLPPAAFMELQSLSVLPIASDMRSLDHLEYTPAPDIVHEAAGHAPLLSNPDYSHYLKMYAEVARRAIMSKDDIDLYETIRVLSDAKENPSSTPQEITELESRLAEQSCQITQISEAALLARMNWWTAEYGLIGSVTDPKIYGAGLLSSVGESKSCLSRDVAKIPFSLDCINYGYNITERQPQLFVTPNFETLGLVLEDFAKMMSSHLSPREAMTRVLNAQSVNTVELSTGLQISGTFSRVIENAAGDVIFLQAKGACQLSLMDAQLSGHGTEIHSQGYSTPLGALVHGVHVSSLLAGGHAELRYESGFIVRGRVESFVKHPASGERILIRFENCRVTRGDETFYQPEWGPFDLAVGSIARTFGGPADRAAFEFENDFALKKVGARTASEAERPREEIYRRLNELRKKISVTPDEIEKFEHDSRNFPDEWLLHADFKNFRAALK